MTAEEKAFHLVEKMYNTDNCHKKHIPNNRYCDCSEINWFQSIQCAIVAVDEIMKTCPQKENEIFGISKGFKYWQEVKQHLEEMI